MDDCKKLTDCLETILNLQREHQEAMKGLEQESRQLLQKVREINVRAAGLQMEVMEVQDALRPPVPVEEEPEAPPDPDLSRLLSRIGIAALLSPLLWNIVAAGVHILQGRAWDLDASGALALTTCICIAWGLLLMAAEPPLNRALEKREARRRASETKEDRAIEEFLNKRCSHKTDDPAEKN